MNYLNDILKRTNKHDLVGKDSTETLVVEDKPGIKRPTNTLTFKGFSE